MTHHSSEKKHLTRTLEIIQCIQCGSGLNASELAERFGVSKRTIYRDLNTIRNSGVHVRFDNHADGYRMLSADNQLTIHRQISLEQLRELILGIYCAPWYQIEGTHPLVDATLELLIDKLDESQRVAIRRLQRACRFFGSPTPVSTLHRDIIQAIADSIMQQQQVELLVIEQDDTRIISPLHQHWEKLANWIRFAPQTIFFENNVWYVSGRNPSCNFVTCFHINNIFNVRFTDEHFTTSRTDLSWPFQAHPMPANQNSLPTQIKIQDENKEALRSM